MPSPPSRFDRIAERIHALKDVFARSGTVVATWRWRGERRYGPYYRVAYRCEGRQCAIYLGASGELVDRVRALLAQLQEPLRLERRLADMRRAATRALRKVKAELNRVFRALGFYPRGFEMRGWRRLEALHRQEALSGCPLPGTEPPPTPSAEKNTGIGAVSLTNTQEAEVLASSATKEGQRGQSHW